MKYSICLFVSVLAMALNACGATVFDSSHYPSSLEDSEESTYQAPPPSPSSYKKEKKEKEVYAKIDTSTELDPAVKEAMASSVVVTEEDCLTLKPSCTSEQCVVYVNDGRPVDFIGEKMYSLNHTTPEGYITVINLNTKGMVMYPPTSYNICGGITFTDGKHLERDQLTSTKPGTFVLANGLTAQEITRTEAEARAAQQ